MKLDHFRSFEIDPFVYQGRDCLAIVYFEVERHPINPRFKLWDVKHITMHFDDDSKIELSSDFEPLMPQVERWIHDELDGYT